MSLRHLWTILLGAVGIAILQIVGTSFVIATTITAPDTDNDATTVQQQQRYSRLIYQDRHDASSLNNNQEMRTSVVNLHHTSIAVLGLADWEVASIEGNTDANSSIASCNPPPHISKQCCIGSFSMGGDIDYQQRYNCHGTKLDDYRKLQQHATKELQLFRGSNDNCDVCRILENSRRHNLTMAFFGDSMTNQVVQGLICELQRRNYVVDLIRIPGKHGEVCKRCIKWTLLLNISSPTWKQEESVQMKFFFQYRYPFYYPEEELEVATSADILVLNLGLHWSWNGRMVETGRMHYRKSLNDFLKFLKRNGTQRMLLYRETSAQHFDADGGDWGLRTNSSSKTCTAIRDFRSEAAGWREGKVVKAARAQGYRLVSALDLPAYDDDSAVPELVVLPWWNFTARHFEMHPTEECSHYCSSPFLYLPLWRGLRVAVDHRFFL